MTTVETGRDIINDILKSFKSQKEYDKTKNKPIKRNFEYRSA